MTQADCNALHLRIFTCRHALVATVRRRLGKAAVRQRERQCQSCLSCEATRRRTTPPNLSGVAAAGKRLLHVEPFETPGEKQPARSFVRVPTVISDDCFWHAFPCRELGRARQPCPGTSGVRFSPRSKGVVDLNAQVRTVVSIFVWPSSS